MLNKIIKCTAPARRNACLPFDIEKKQQKNKRNHPNDFTRTHRISMEDASFLPKLHSCHTLIRNPVSSIKQLYHLCLLHSAHKCTHYNTSTVALFYYHRTRSKTRFVTILLSSDTVTICLIIHLLPFAR